MTAKHSKKKRDVLLGIWLCMIAIVALIMLYGVINHPYPIRYRDGGYYNKVNSKVTEEQYRSFKAWERVLLGAFGLLGIVSVPLAIREGRRKGR